MIDLSGKTALIVHNSVLGGGVAERLAKSGAEIILGNKRSSEPIDAIIGSMRVEALTLGDPTNLATEIAALEAIHIAVIAARWGDPGAEAFMETDPATWKAAISENFEQSVYAAQAVAKQMIAQGSGGRIIFLSSVAALKPFKDMSIVGTSLAALHALAKMAAVDLAPHRITVNVVALGRVDTTWVSRDSNPRGDPFTLPGIPAGRAASVEEIGDLVCFLASPQAEYITGAIIPIDGGYSITKTVTDDESGQTESPQ